MRVWARWGMCAWAVVSAGGCGPEVSPGARRHTERSLTLRAEVGDASLEGNAPPESPDAGGSAGEGAPEVFDGAVPRNRALFLVQQDGHKLGLPLQSASYDSFVVGTVAETVVTQRYFNPLPSTIEAVYVFPLPHDGAVYEYSIAVQERSLHGEMKRRAEALATYEAAKRAGHTAGLLEQERPNVFTQSVANIPPGETIEVELRVVQPLAREHGRYALVLPTVVGPRYVPGVPTAPTPPGSFAPDTDRVPDGSRVTPGGQLGNAPCPNVSIHVAIEQGQRATDVRSKHHAVELHDENGVAHVELSAASTLADRDFELSWSEAGEHTQASLMVQPDPEREAEAGYFTLTIEPPRALPPARAVPRELVFVVDASGSMEGEPIETAKDAMRKVLRRLAPGDVFQIVQFSQSASSLGNGFLPNTPASVQRGLEFIDAIQGEGGTEMLSGIHAALDLPHDPERLRMVLFLTDGYIGNESEIFRAVHARIGGARLFSLGVGSSVNRYLLDGLARMGRGDVSYVSPGERPDAVVDRFYQRIDRPALTDVAIDWGDLTVEDVEPQRLPDLFAGKPVVVFGRYRGQPHGEITLRGSRAGRSERVPVQVDFGKPSTSSAALSAMWARSRIARWSDELIDDASGAPGAHAKDLERRITELALQHHVMTQYTAFVAVDDARAVQPGTQTLHMPVALPSGVSARGALGNDPMSALGQLMNSTVGASFGLGGLGLSGTSRGGGGGGGEGYGSGAGGFRGRDAMVPRIRSEQVDVRGALSKEVVRRILHLHRNEVRFCYEQELIRRPDLRGRVSVKFIISETGAVVTAALASSTLATPRLESCIVTAVRRWTFPTSASGVVVVTAPFMLEPTS